MDLIFSSVHFVHVYWIVLCCAVGFVAAGISCCGHVMYIRVNNCSNMSVYYSAESCWMNIVSCLLFRERPRVYWYNEVLKFFLMVLCRRCFIELRCMHAVTWLLVVVMSCKWVLFYCGIVVAACYVKTFVLCYCCLRKPEKWSDCMTNVENSNHRQMCIFYVNGIKCNAELKF